MMDMIVCSDVQRFNIDARRFMEDHLDISHYTTRLHQMDDTTRREFWETIKMLADFAADLKAWHEAAIVTEV